MNHLCAARQSRRMADGQGVGECPYDFVGDQRLPLLVVVNKFFDVSRKR